MQSTSSPGSRWVCLPATTESPSRSREFVRRALVDWSLRELVDDAILLVSELATNAVVHARSAMVVGALWSPDAGVLRVCVHDDVPVAPVVRHPEPDATSGRGIEIVDTVAARWGVDEAGQGKVVWFELRAAA